MVNMQTSDHRLGGCYSDWYLPPQANGSSAVTTSWKSNFRHPGSPPQLPQNRAPCTMKWVRHGFIQLWKVWICIFGQMFTIWQGMVRRKRWIRHQPKYKPKVHSFFACKAWCCSFNLTVGMCMTYFHQNVPSLCFTFTSLYCSLNVSDTLTLPVCLSLCVSLSLFIVCVS